MARRIYSGQKIKKLMDDGGLSMGQVAKEAGLTAAAVWGLVHERTKNVKFTTLAGVAAALGVPIQAILADDAPVSDASEVAALYALLSPVNRAALAGAAKALLEAQRKSRK